MHHHIIVKAWASDSEEAESNVRSEMEDSILPENNTCGWDYVDHVVLINRLELSSEWGVKTFEELEKNKIKGRLKDLKDLQIQIKDDLMIFLAPYFLSKDEAPLCLNIDNEDLKAYIEKLMKGKDIKKPDTYEKLVDTFSKILTKIAQKDTGHSMIMYHMEQIKKLQYCIESDELYSTLQSTHNYYAELPCDDKTGLSPFYFICDRHF